MVDQLAVEKVVEKDEMIAALKVVHLAAQLVGWTASSSVGWWVANKVDRTVAYWTVQWGLGWAGVSVE